MIVTTAEELEAFRHGDAGRCAATLDIPGALGQSITVRCTRGAYHRKNGHRVHLGNRASIRWPGVGTSSALGWPSLPPRAIAPASA